jgi:type I restriction enzyme S subunit
MAEQTTLSNFEKDFESQDRKEIPKNEMKKERRSRRDTELGEIPEKWRKIRLGDLAEVRYGKAKPNTKGTIPVVGSGGIYSYTSHALVSSPTLVIGRKGTAGMTWLLEKPSWPSDTTFYLFWKKIDVDYHYIFNFLQANPLSGEYAKTTLPSLKKSDLENLQIPLPPLPEQQEIAAILSSVDDTIQETQSIIDQTQKLKRGLMQQLFTKGIGHTKFKKTKIGEIPEEWDTVSINSICNVRRGASPRPISSPKYFAEKGRGWVRISDVTSSFKYLRTTKQYLSKLGESKSVKVDPGELIMSICATIGRPIIVDMKACIHDGFVVFKNLTDEIDTKFLFYYIQKIERKLASKGQYGTQKNLNTRLVGSEITPVAPLPEQQKIAAILSSVDEKIEKEEQYKSQLEKLKKGLMHDLLTGNVRVKIKRT